MKFKARIKRLLAKTLIKIAKIKFVDSIQVSNRCGSCYAKRNTLYYHFHDKYHLIAWIFMQMYETKKNKLILSMEKI